MTCKTIWHTVGPVMASGSSGFIYVAIGRKYYAEAQISARSLRRFTTHPIHLFTDQQDATTDALFDDVTVVGDEFGTSFAVKISALRAAPFERTVFLDGDTFVCRAIDDLFDVLDYYDMAMAQGPSHHSNVFWQQHRPGYKLRYENVIPEFNTGVIAIKRSAETKRLLDLWMKKHEELGVDADMPTFREAYLESPVRIGVLPIEYNFFGIMSFAIAEDYVRVIHGRIGERWDNLRTHVPPFEVMDEYARKLNSTHIKRLVVPNVGVIPYNWNPFSIKKRIKRALGIKWKRKAETL